ncbi:4Fe-4S dicluster domain-containing protein [Candidatus Thorarchaeota archaeon]|jgi:heterodisulfide reductase subunit C|nr:MAG: 4Fe-4S dicluster domain-containing protein [Candidatus Thorarchaeota archaeon]
MDMAKEGPPIVHEPSSGFAVEIEKEPGGEGIMKCIQCGMCTASCMVASMTDRYRPRKLIQKILLGKREEVLASDLPWLCMSCKLCEERCQEDVDLSEIFTAVREIAAREGHIPPVYRQTVDKVLEDGWLLKDSYTDFEEDDRDDLGLDPDLNWNSKFVKKLKKKYLKGGKK